MRFFTFVLSILFFANTGRASEPMLTLVKAKEVAARAQAYALKKGWKISIAIVNSEGNSVYFERNDGAFFGSIEAALAKARSSSAFRRPTKVFADDVKSGRTGLISLPNVAAIEGARPIMVGDSVIGAIGVSGARATEDDECALAGLEERARQ